MFCSVVCEFFNCTDFLLLFLVTCIIFCFFFFLIFELIANLPRSKCCSYVDNRRTDTICTSFQVQRSSVKFPTTTIITIIKTVQRKQLTHTLTFWQIHKPTSCKREWKSERERERVGDYCKSSSNSHISFIHRQQHRHCQQAQQQQQQQQSKDYTLAFDSWGESFLSPSILTLMGHSF